MFDGLGGAGGETIKLGDLERTGAWLASRQVRNVVLTVYDELIRYEGSRQSSIDSDSYD